MEPSNQPQNYQAKPMLPNATAVLVLGICSIVIACVGLILGIIGIVLAGKGRKMYKESPNSYEGWGQLNAGYIMSIIGTCIGGIYLLYLIIWGVFLGSAVMWWGTNANNY